MDAGRIDWRCLMQPDGMFAALVHRGATAASIAGNCVGNSVRAAYLATPYVEGVTQGGRWRFEKSIEIEVRAAHVQHQLLRAGCPSLSPVVQWAAMAQAALALDRRERIDPLDAVAWGLFAGRLRAICGLVVVPDLPGWQQSAAVWADVVWALDHATPVHFMGGV